MGTDYLNSRFPRSPSYKNEYYDLHMFLTMFFIIEKKLKISFTLYPAHCRVGRRNLVLRPQLALLLLK